MDFHLDAQIRLHPAQQGGRSAAIQSHFRPTWDLGNKWLGVPTFNDGSVLLDGGGAIEPGAEGGGRIVPRSPENWGNVRVGMVLPMREGSQVIGQATIASIHRGPLLTADVLAFVLQARQYCAQIERSAPMAMTARLETTRQRLLMLYQAALTLPGAEREIFTSPPRTGAVVEGWVGFGAQDAYWVVRDPFVYAGAEGGVLSADLLGIFADIKSGLSHWDADSAGEAVWLWRSTFEKRWGQQAVDALRVLHRACQAKPPSP
jgi:Domain of unknown function (DUF5063)